MNRVNLAALMGVALGAAVQDRTRVRPMPRPSYFPPSGPIGPVVSEEEAEKVREEQRARRQRNFNKQKKG